MPLSFHTASTPLAQVAQSISEAIITILCSPGTASSDQSEKKCVVVGIDGQSGAGKTSLASLILPLVQAHGFRCASVELESFIEGWEGLIAGTERVASCLLQPIKTQKWAELTAWDWNSMRWGKRMRIPHTGKVDVLLLVGCGATSKACSTYIDVSVWIETEADTRKKRVQERESGVQSWWDGWRLQEESLLEAHNSRISADFYIHNSDLAHTSDLVHSSDPAHTSDLVHDSDLAEQ